MKLNIQSSLTAFLLGVLVVLSYLLVHIVPMTDIYLGSDREGYALFVFAAAVVGCGLLLWGMKKGTEKGMRTVLIVLGLMLIVGLPLLMLVRNAGSFRGLEWSLETLLFGFIPVAFLLMALLILKGWRPGRLVMTLVFTLVALYHIVHFFKIVGKRGLAFSSVTGPDLLLSAAISVFAAFCAFVNFRAFKTD